MVGRLRYRHKSTKTRNSMRERGIGNFRDDGLLGARR